MKKFTRTGIVILLAIVVVMTLSFWMVKLQKGKPESSSSSSSSSETEIGDVYIVIDNSYSTNKNADKGSGADPDRLAIKCADAFYEKSPIGSATGWLTFSSKTDMTGDLAIKYEDSQKPSWDQAYDQTGTASDTSMALNTAENLLGSGISSNQAIILITDGTTTGMAYEPTDVNNPIPVYCVFINEGVNEEEAEAREFLGDIAEKSGTGKIYEVKSADDVDAVMDEIVKAIYK